MSDRVQIAEQEEPLLFYALSVPPRRSKFDVDRATDATISLPHGDDREVSASQESDGDADHNGDVPARDASQATGRGRRAEHAADGTGATGARGLAPVAREARLSLTECRALLPPGFEVGDDELEAVRDELYRVAEVAVEAAHGARLRPR